MYVLTESMLVIPILCRLFDSIQFTDSTGNPICDSNSILVLIVNDLYDNQVILDPLYIQSTNSYSVLLSSPLVYFDSSTNKVRFQISELEIRNVL